MHHTSALALMATSTSITGDISRIEDLLSVLSKKVDDLNSLTNSEAITFSGLALKSKKESTSWLMINSPNERGGLVIDFHTFMENIQQTMVGTDSIARLNSLYKLKIDTMSQRIAIISFERTIPSFFSTSSAHKVIKDAQSYFDTIVDYAAWDKPGDGFKDALKAEITDFESSHTQVLNDEIVAGSKLHTLAILSLASSITFANGLISFIPDTYKEYTLAKFSPSKAWSITTRLARRIISHVAQPRIGVQKTFKAGNPDKIGEAIFWLTLKSLDLMVEITKGGFRDSPIVASELVKFLALNTGFDALDALTSSNEKLKIEVADLKKIITGTSKTLVTDANKLNDQKSLIENLTRRLAKL
jgi:hypothetical protein